MLGSVLISKRMLSLWSAYFVGFCLPFAQKACTTFEMVLYLWLFHQPVFYSVPLRIVRIWQPWQKPQAWKFFLFSKSVHVKVTAFDGLALFLPSPPGSSFVVVCSSHYCLLTGSRCSSEVSHELILLGSGDIFEVLYHLFGEVKMLNWGEFIVVPVPVSWESICKVISFPCKPLTISLNVRVYKYLSVMSCRIDVSCHWYWVIAVLAKVGFLHPPFGCCAVGHWQCAVSSFESAIDNVNPGHDHCSKKYD